MAQQGLTASAQRLFLALVAAVALVGVAPANVSASSGCFTAGYVNLHFQPDDIGRANMDIQYCVTPYHSVSRTVTTVYNTTAVQMWWYSIDFVNGNVSNYCNGYYGGYTVIYQHSEGLPGRYVAPGSSASETWVANQAVSFNSGTWVVVRTRVGDSRGCAPFRAFIMA